MNLLALVDKYVSGWPEKDDERALCLELEAILTHRFDTDVHFAAYTCAVERRHTNASLARADEAGVRMVAAVFDVDGPDHKCPDDWWAEQKKRIEILFRIQPNGFAYRTRGGYRIFYKLPEAFPIDAQSADTWTRQYVGWCNYLSTFGIEADRSCKTWTRLFRAPHTVRDGELQELETIGDPRAVGVWNGPVVEREEGPPAPVARPAPAVAQPSARARAAAELLGKSWPQRGRHEAQLALAGALCRDRWSQEGALEFLCAVCRVAGDEDRPKRAATIQRTYAEHAANRPISGWTALGTCVDSAIVDAARRLIDPNAQALAELQALGTTGAKPAPEPQEMASRRIPPADRAMRIGGSETPRLKTGIVSIDTATRGGILVRKLGVIGGAPGAGKTALLCRLGFGWLSQNIPVAVLASDEDADALLIRFGQLSGLSREALESGDPAARRSLSAWCKAVPLILADGDEEDATIENVSQELRTRAGGGPSVLLVDSMQTARSAMEMPKGTDLRTRVNETVRVLKRAAKVDGHLVLASSELSKAAYRNKAQAENVNALSAFKESGDIEYGVSLALVLTSASGTSDLVDAAIVKNRLGPGKPEFVMKLDHERADIRETTKEECELRDPLYFVKVDVMQVVEGSGGASRRAIAEHVQCRRSDALKAINELVRDGKIVDAKEGIRLPLPGEPGYAETA